MKFRHSADQIWLGTTTLVESLRAFLMPPTDAIVNAHDFEMNWRPNGPWRPVRKLKS